jgi:hypothetical protein
MPALEGTLGNSVVLDSERTDFRALGGVHRKADILLSAVPIRT